MFKFKFNCNLRQKIKAVKRRSHKLYNKLFIYLPVDILIFLRIKPLQDKRKSIIIFRHDGIGDYVLFRNFMEILKKSPKFAGYKITLLGNAAWKDLSEFLDKGFIDEFIWLDKKKFTGDFFYRYKKFKEITSVKYEILIHPFSREFFNADNDLACLMTAGKKIGSIGISRFIKPYKKKILEKIYTELIPDVENVWFEFYKNKNFFERILSEKINTGKPFINLPTINPPSPSSELYENLAPYAAFFIGASVKHRKWPAKNFAETALYLHKKYGYNIVLCGGKSELSDAAEFKNYLKTKKIDIDNSIKSTHSGNNTPLTDTVGKISLVDLLYVAKNASLVISNETMAPHIAMALANANETADDDINSTNSNAAIVPIVPIVPTAVSKPAVIVISAGEASYGHFSPYPEEMGGNYTAVFHPYIEKKLKEYINIMAAFGRGYNDRFDISEIPVKALIDKLDKIHEINGGNGVK